MQINSLSTAFTTACIEETRDFYVHYLGAEVIFDCGWYVSLQFGNDNATLQFMSPREGHHSLSESNGITYNLGVNDVDSEYMRLRAAGIVIIVPLEDHPWGDRGFAITDPNGISLYIYSEREPDEEFKSAFKPGTH